MNRRSRLDEEDIDLIKQWWRMEVAERDVDIATLRTEVVNLRLEMQRKDERIAFLEGRSWRSK